MKFKIISDYHLEFYRIGEIAPSLPVSPNEKDTVLLIAGDLGVATKPESYTDFLYEMSERFMYVVYIAGNHEFYGGSLVNGRDIINKNLIELDNVEMVEREVLEFDGVRVLAATLWTDFDGADPISMQTAQQLMSDYYTIRTGNADDPTSHRLYADDLLHDFRESRNFIFDELDNAKKDGKRCIVMTHHAPSRLSISPQFAMSDINGAFASDLSNAIIDLDYEFTWIHGHMHQNQDYKLGKCRVLCNPYGYHNENAFFNPELEIDV